MPGWQMQHNLLTSPKMLPPGTSTQLIGTTYLPSLPPKEISYICRHLQAYPQEPTVPRNQNNLKAARSSSESQKRQVIWNSLQSCSAAHKLQNSTTRKVRILYIFWRMVRVTRAFCAAAVVVFLLRWSKSWQSVICLGGCMIMYVSGGAVEADKLILGHAVV